jgi:hypothetical protein
MTSATVSRAVCTIEPTPDDRHDQPYRFGKPLSYLSERQQARLVIVRGRLHDTPAIAERRAGRQASTVYGDRSRA